MYEQCPSTKLTMHCVQISCPCTHSTYVYTYVYSLIHRAIHENMHTLHTYYVRMYILTYTLIYAYMYLTNTLQTGCEQVAGYSLKLNIRKVNTLY